MYANVPRRKNRVPQVQRPAPRFCLLLIAAALLGSSRADAMNLKWFNKDLFNTTATNATDVDFIFTGATATQIENAVGNTFTPAGFTGPTYIDATGAGGEAVVVVQWQGAFPSDPGANNKKHFGVKIDLDDLPNNGANLKFKHINLTLNGVPFVGRPACAMPKVVFVDSDTLDVDITAPDDDPGITVDEITYSFVPAALPLADLNGDNLSIVWTTIPGSFDVNRDGTSNVEQLSIPPSATHVIVGARVRFQGESSLGAGHVFFQSALPLGGACCLPGPTCTVEDSQVCVSMGGIFQGGGTTCAEVVCAKPIPTVSEWGLMVMALLLLTTGTVILGRRRRMVQPA